MNESVMIVVTVASVALAVAMGFILAFILRHERRRSDARAAMLAEMVAASAPAVDADFDLQNDFTPELDLAHPGSHDLFAARAERSAWPRRLAIVGALSVVIVAAGTLARSSFSPGASPIEHVRTEPAASLDLLSLQHAQDGGALTITGLVQNPRKGATMTKVVATAMLFGADETFIASGRTPLDLTTLRPGDESGFVITVPLASSAANAVTRYRIGFRGEDGSIIGHIDRRMASAIARGPS